MDNYGIIIFLIVWILLQKVILPKLGIPTCMSGACSVPKDNKKTVENINTEK